MKYCPLRTHSFLPLCPSHRCSLRRALCPQLKSRTRKTSRRSDLLTEATSIRTPSLTRPEPRAQITPARHVTGISDAGIVKSANAAIWRMENPPEHCFVSTQCLRNDGVLLEMNSESTTRWLNTPATWASFLNHFAPNMSVKEWAFPIVVLPTSATCPPALQAR